MNERISSITNILITVAIIFIFLWAAIKSMSVPGSLSVYEAIDNFIPAWLTLGSFMTIKIFLTQGVATLISIALIAISLTCFYYGLNEDKDVKQNALFTFAGAAFGLGSGIPIGKSFNNKQKKHL